MKSRIAALIALSCFILVSPAHAVLYSVTDLGFLPGDAYSFAYAINNSGQIVGESDDSSGNAHAYVWSSAGGMVNLGVLPGGSSAIADGINDSGEVTGDSVAARSECFSGTPGGGMHGTTTFGDLRSCPNRKDASE